MLVAACGSSSDSSGQTSAPDGSPPASASGSPSAAGPSDLPDQQQPPNRLTIDVDIAGGQVTPTNAQLQGKVGEPIILQVTSDVADELHVHSVPDHTFPVEAKPNQRFQFTADVPGNVEIELHDLNRVVASVQVRQ
ncbi:hypothetical protein ACN27E_19055 [Mycobacterium sp. WMMD1722]|uniref:hypothetical protein n=1 Tax=Mycobacterium sp. WMMD1722 TaxID=3404117 RepID=UPI003BF60CCE